MGRGNSSGAGRDVAHGVTQVTDGVPLQRVISGGQTGVDRAALDAALAVGLPVGGSVPRGRRAEDGVVPARYPLTELDSADYAARTERNVLDADATLILKRGALTGGTALTLRLARRWQRPVRVVDVMDPPPVAEFLDWLQDNDVRVLNVAGPRESGAPGIYGQARRLLEGWLRQVQRLRESSGMACSPGGVSSGRTGK